MSKKKIHYIIPFKKRVRAVGSMATGTAIAVALFIFANNFVVDGEFIIRGGNIVIKDAPIFTQILVDSKLKGKIETEKEAKNFKLKRLKPGKHTIIATLHAHWPWVRSFEIQAGKTLHITPLFIPQKIITKNVKHAPEQIPLPNRTSPITIKREDVKNIPISIWVDNNGIYSQYGTNQTPVAVFTADYPIHSLALYPNRTDTLLIAAGDKVFALDITKNKTRNFLPIYKGTSPTFTIDKKDGTIFVKDGKNILKLDLPQ